VSKHHRVLDEAELGALRQRHRVESQTIEFKKSLALRKEALEALCGMVNADVGRGTVVFGLDPKGSVVGVEPGDLDMAQRSLSDHIRNKFDPTLIHTLGLGEAEGKIVVILEAQRARGIPYHEYDGRAYIREGSTSRQLSVAEKGRLVRARDRDQHNGPWRCDTCGAMAGNLSQPIFTATPTGLQVTRGYQCGCGGEFWPL